MSVLLYFSSGNATGEAVEKIVSSMIPQEKLKIFNTTETFSVAIRRCSIFESTAIVVVAAPYDLRALSDHRSILRDIRLLLILPDHKRETVSSGHKFFPRFIGYADSDLADVAAVLGNLVNRKKGTSGRLRLKDRLCRQVNQRHGS